MVKSGQNVVAEFTTSHPSTGAATDADSLPTAVLTVDGTDDAATVTVTDVGTGRYKAAVTLPTLTAGQLVAIVVSATVNSVAGSGVVWQDVASLDYVADAVWDEALAGHATAGSAGDALGSITVDLTPVLDAIAALPDDTDVADVLAALALVKTKTDTIGAVSVTVTSPAAADGTLTLEQGDSYPAARSRSITMAVADQTHALLLDVADCTVYLRGSQFTWEAASVTETVAGYDVVFEPTVAQTAALTIQRQTYKLIACYDNADPASDDATTIERGTVVLAKDIPAVS